MDPITLSLLIGGGVAAGGSVLSFFGSKKDSEKQIEGIRLQNEANARLAAQQRDWNERMWHEQNAYNSPIEQMNRLKAGGLNPNLIYGGSPSGTTGTADAVRGYDRAEARSMYEGYQRFADTTRNVSTMANTAVSMAQRAVLQQDAAKKALETENLVVDQAKKEFDLGLAKDLRSTSVQAAQANAERALMEAMKSGSEARVAKATESPQIKIVETEVKKKLAELKGQELINALRQLEKQLNQKGIQKSDNLIMRVLGQSLGDQGVKDLFKYLQRTGQNLFEEYTLRSFGK